MIQNDLKILGNRDGAVVKALASHQRSPGLFPARCYTWVEFVVGSGLCWFSGFPPSTKSNILNSKFDLETVNEEPFLGIFHCKFLFIYLIINFMNI